MTEKLTLKDGEMDTNNKITSFQLKRGCHFGWNIEKGWNLEITSFFNIPAIWSYGALVLTN
jgi:hypothetical protein